MSKSIGVVAIKGGVGKTSIASSLAASLVNHYGKKVLLVDGNYSAPNLGLHMDIIEPNATVHDVLAGKAMINSAIHRRYGVDVIPGSLMFEKDIPVLKLKDKIGRIKSGYDFVIIDGSPSMNDEILSTILASDILFVVSTGDYPTLSCSIRASEIAKQRGKPIGGIILNKVRDPRYEIGLNEIEEASGIPVIAKIPDDKYHVRSLYTRIPAILYNERSKASKEIMALAASLVGKKESVSWIEKVFPSHRAKEQVNRQLFKESFYSSSFN